MSACAVVVSQLKLGCQVAQEASKGIVGIAVCVICMLKSERAKDAKEDVGLDKALPPCQRQKFA